MSRSFRTYSVLPSVGDVEHHLAGGYRDSVIAAARLVEDSGLDGTLIHDNLRGVDPWSLVPVVLAATRHIVPLVATTATAQPPHALARTVASAACLFGRQVALNVVTGSDPTERQAIGDRAGHDERYARAEAHISCVRAMLAGDGVTTTGPGWSYDRFVLEPSVPADLRPEVFVAGSSAAGLATAAAVADVAVTHAGAPDDAASNEFLHAAAAAGLEPGIRIGLLARPDTASAWAEAQRRFPRSRRADLVLLQKTRSESDWVRGLATRARHDDHAGDGVWFGAFASGRSHAAYLVGSHEQVADLLAGYHRAGYRRLLLDGLHTEEDYAHATEVLEMTDGLLDRRAAERT